MNLKSFYNLEACTINASIELKSEFLLMCLIFFILRLVRIKFKPYNYCLQYSYGRLYAYILTLARSHGVARDH